MNKEEKKFIVDKMKRYVNTYDENQFFDEESFIKDMIYGIGVSLSNKNRFRGSFQKFLQRLKLILE